MSRKAQKLAITIIKEFLFRQLLFDATEPYRSPAAHELVMDVDGVVVDGGSTGVVVKSWQ